MGEDGQIKCDSEEVQEMDQSRRQSIHEYVGRISRILDFLAEDFKDFPLRMWEEGDLKE